MVSVAMYWFTFIVLVAVSFMYTELQHYGSRFIHFNYHRPTNWGAVYKCNDDYSLQTAIWLVMKECSYCMALYIMINYTAMYSWLHKTSSMCVADDNLVQGCMCVCVTVRALFYGWVTVEMRPPLPIYYWLSIRWRGSCCADMSSLSCAIIHKCMVYRNIYILCTFAILCGTCGC